MKLKERARDLVGDMYVRHPAKQKFEDKINEKLSGCVFILIGGIFITF